MYFIVGHVGHDFRFLLCRDEQDGNSSAVELVQGSACDLTGVIDGYCGEKPIVFRGDQAIQIDHLRGNRGTTVPDERGLVDSDRSTGCGITNANDLVSIIDRESRAVFKSILFEGP